MSDEAEYFVVVSTHATDAIDSAKSLLELAALAKDQVQASSAAASAVVAAVAHLARATEIGLIFVLASKEAEEGGKPKEWEAERRIHSSLESRLHQLTEEKLGPDVVLDRRRPLTRVLIRAIRLRNALVHDRGTFLSGTLEEVKAEVVGEHVMIPVPTPTLEWRRVSLDVAAQVVEAVEAFLNNLLVAQEESSLDDRFFSRARGGASASQRLDGRSRI